MMKYRRFTLIGAIICWMALICPLRTQAEETGKQTETGACAETDVILQADCGFDGMVRAGVCVPVSLRVQNDSGADRQAVCAISLQEEDREVCSYEVPVNLPAGRESHLTTYIPVSSQSDQIYVTLTEEGRTLARQRLKPDFGREAAPLFIGTLCDDPQDLGCFDNLSLDYGLIRTKVRDFTAEDFPDRPEGLELLDLLVINAFRVRDLSEAQSQALLSWVRNGGILLLGTGARAEDTLGRFAPEFLEAAYEGPEDTEVLLESEEEEEAGGQETVLTIPCISFSLTGGSVVLAGEYSNLIESAPYRKGTVAAAAFDFADIASYMDSHADFPAEILQTILGEERLQEAAGRRQTGSGELFTDVQKMIDSGNVSRLPDVGLYTLEIGIYVLLSGIGIYSILKQKDRTRYYRPLVLLLSGLFTGIIFLMGSSTRFRGTLCSYARFLEYSADTVSDTTYMNLRSPYSRTERTELAENYMVRPVTETDASEAGRVKTMTEEDTAAIRILREAEKTVIETDGIPAFEARCYKLTDLGQSGAGEGIEGYLEEDGQGLRGEITSCFSRKLVDCVLLLSGQMVLLGDLEPGQTLTLDSPELLVYPESYPESMAAAVTGLYQYPQADIEDTDYLQALRDSGMLEFYMKHMLAAAPNQARFLGIFAREDQAPQALLSDISFTGQTLIAADLEICSEEDSDICRSGQLRTPSVGSGSYDALHHALTGGEPTVLEYYLGNDVRISSIRMKRISEEFLFRERPGTEAPAVFEGDIYFYNHSSGRFDLMEADREEYDSSEIAPYLSPGNTITVRYVPAGETAFRQELLLPKLYIVGREF